jgi:hypothetical protein
MAKINLDELNEDQLKQLRVDLSIQLATTQVAAANMITVIANVDNIIQQMQLNKTGYSLSGSIENKLTPLNLPKLKKMELPIKQ